MEHIVLNHVFVRHPPLHGMQGRCYGRLDVALAPAVIDAAAGVLASKLPSWPVVSSPAQRCLALARVLRPQGASVDARLQEMNFGEWEGCQWAQVPRDALDAWSADVVGFKPPAGESFGALIARVREALKQLSRPHVIITHAGVIRAAWHLHGGLCARDAAAVAVPFAIPVVPARTRGEGGRRRRR